MENGLDPVDTRRARGVDEDEEQIPVLYEGSAGHSDHRTAATRSNVSKSHLRVLIVRRCDAPVAFEIMDADDHSTSQATRLGNSSVRLRTGNGIPAVVLVEWALSGSSKFRGIPVPHRRRSSIGRPRRDCSCPNAATYVRELQNAGSASQVANPILPGVIDELANAVLVSVEYRPASDQPKPISSNYTGNPQDRSGGIGRPVSVDPVQVVIYICLGRYPP